MKIVLQVLLIIFLGDINVLLAEIPAGQEEKIGHEYIESSEYPKFSVMGQYGFNKFGKILGHEGMSGKAKGDFGGGLLFDVPLNKYFAAGAGISVSMRNAKKGDPIISRFSFLARPKISFFNKLTLFARFGLGLDVMLLQPLVQLSEVNDDVRQRVGETFGSGVRIALASPGINAGATIGIEYFPISRIGFSVEWGIRADLFHIRKSELLERYGIVDPIIPPNYFNYFVYDMPLMATIHIIL